MLLHSSTPCAGTRVGALDYSHVIGGTMADTQWLHAVRPARGRAEGRVEVNASRSRTPHRAPPPGGRPARSGGYHAARNEQSMNETHPGPPGRCLSTWSAGPRRRRHRRRPGMVVTARLLRAASRSSCSVRVTPAAAWSIRSSLLFPWCCLISHMARRQALLRNPTGPHDRRQRSARPYPSKAESRHAGGPLRARPPINTERVLPHG